MMRGVAMAFGVAVLGPTTVLADSADILECARSNAPTESFRQAAEMAVFQSGEEQRRVFATFAGMRQRNELLLNIAVDAPADVSGTALLLRHRDDGSEDLKLYLPALRRVRTVTGAMAGQSLLGTDFSYADLKQVYGAFDDGEVATLEPGQWDEAPTRRLSLTPKEDNSPYAFLQADFEPDKCLPVRIEFFRGDGSLAKRLEAAPESLMSVGERWLLARYTMSDLDAGTSTVLHMGPPIYDDKIRRTAFSPMNFYNYHNRVEAPADAEN